MNAQLQTVGQHAMQTHKNSVLRKSFALAAGLAVAAMATTAAAPAARASASVSYHMGSVATTTLNGRYATAGFGTNAQDTIGALTNSVRNTGNYFSGGDHFYGNVGSTQPLPTKMCVTAKADIVGIGLGVSVGFPSGVSVSGSTTHKVVQITACNSKARTVNLWLGGSQFFKTSGDTTKLTISATVRVDWPASGSHAAFTAYYGSGSKSVTVL